MDGGASEPVARAAEALVIATRLLTTVTLAVRIWVRARLTRIFGWEDGLLLFSQAFFITFGVMYCTMSSENQAMLPHRFSHSKQNSVSLESPPNCTAI